MSFINDRFRRLVDAQHRKNSAAGKQRMMSLGAVGMQGGHGDGHQHGGEMDSNSSTYAEASIRSDPNVYAVYTSETKLPFSAFQSLRKQPPSSDTGSSTQWEHSPEVKLTEQQEANVRKALKKVAEGQSSIDEPHPFVSAFIEKHCTALSEYLPNNVTRAGATFLVLAVMCGHADLVKECIQLRAQPNSAAYLSWPAPPPSTELDGDAPMTRHGFSPFFLAVVCQQLEIAELLLDCGANISTTDRWGRTPLHAAYTLGDDEMVQWLLKRKALQSSFDRDRLRPGEDVHDVYPPPLNRPRVQMYLPTKEEAAKEVAEGKGDPKNRPRGSAAPHEDRLICTATRAEASMCHCQDCLEERLRLERAISNWLSPQYLEVLAAAADLERDQREQKATQAAQQAQAQIHQQQLADALGAVVREQQMQDARKAPASGSKTAEEQTPSPTAVVGESS